MGDPFVGDPYVGDRYVCDRYVCDRFETPSARDPRLPGISFFPILSTCYSPVWRIIDSMHFKNFPASIVRTLVIALIVTFCVSATMDATPGRPPRKRESVRRPQPAQVIAKQAENSAHRPMRVTADANYTLIECDIRDLHIAVVDTGITMHQFADQRPQAIAAMNGGFFDYFNGKMTPTGLVISDDVVYAPAACRVCALDDARGRDGKLARKACSEQVWYDIFAVDQSRQLSIIHSTEFDSHFGATASELRLAIEAGPTLVRDGAPAGRANLPGKFSRRRYPRSAFGVTSEGRILMLTTKKGYPLYEVANILADHGAVWAMNLDGDSSANMVVRGNEKASIACGPRAKLNSIIYVTQ